MQPREQFESKTKEFIFHDDSAHNGNQKTIFIDGAEQICIPWPKPKTVDDYFNTIELADGRRPKRFQAENVWFAIEKAGFRCLIADDTGLGKTISSLSIVREMGNAVLPLLIVCKTTLKMQWYYEILSTLGIVAQIIRTSNDDVLENYDCWIISYDLLKKLNTLGDLTPRMMIMDECQLIKNWSSARTQAMVEFCKSVPYIIGLSATPIKNNFPEFFPFLHIIHPSRFTNQAMIENMAELVQTSSGAYRYGGLATWAEKRFKELTDDVVIRHTREEVAPELPAVFRTHRFVTVEESKAAEALVRETQNFLDLYNRAKDWDSENELETKQEIRQKARASMLKMRHIIGDAKVPYALDFIESFLGESPDRRLTVFVHHKSVAQAIIAGVGEMMAKGTIDILPPFILRGGMSEKERDELVFNCNKNGGWPSADPRARLLIASTLAAGEGINLQRCYDALMVERQFNPANEEQAIGGDSGGGRFSRFGIDASIANIFVTFLTAKKTLDDWFHRLVETKRKAVRKSLGDQDRKGNVWNGEEEEVIEELMDIVAEEASKFINNNNRKRKLKVKKLNEAEGEEAAS